LLWQRLICIYRLWLDLSFVMFLGSVLGQLQ
jgi:hypothetical protein